jgi:hypothetical protein
VSPRASRLGFVQAGDLCSPLRATAVYGACERAGISSVRNIMRGYVRLRAEEQGCELALDYSAATSPSPARGRAPRDATVWELLEGDGLKPNTLPDPRHREHFRLARRGASLGKNIQHSHLAILTLAPNPAASAIFFHILSDVTTT